jgi:hypothetical protein
VCFHKETVEKRANLQKLRFHVIRSRISQGVPFFSIAWMFSIFNTNQVNKKQLTDREIQTWEAGNTANRILPVSGMRRPELRTGQFVMQEAEHVCSANWWENCLLLNLETPSC